MSRLILVRHGQTAWHAEGRYAGTADVPLDEVGKEQSSRVAAYLADAGITRIFSSPLSRCHYLAEEASRRCGARLTVDDRLREIDLGRWDGLDYRTIVEQDGEMLHQWLADPASAGIPGGGSTSGGAGSRYSVAFGHSFRKLGRGDNGRQPRGADSRNDRSCT